MDNRALIETLKKASECKDKATLEIIDLCMAAAVALEQMQDQLELKDRQIVDANKHRAELDDALREMVGQYCSFDGKLDHEFMIAGAKAFDALGLENGASTNILWHGALKEGKSGD